MSHMPLSARVGIMAYVFEALSNSKVTIDFFLLNQGSQDVYFVLFDIFIEWCERVGFPLFPAVQNW